MQKISDYEYLQTFTVDIFDLKIFKDKAIEFWNSYDKVTFFFAVFDSPTSYTESIQSPSAKRILRVLGLSELRNITVQNFTDSNDLEFNQDVLPARPALFLDSGWGVLINEKPVGNSAKIGSFMEFSRYFSYKFSIY